MKRAAKVLLTICSAILATPSIACDDSPDLPILPGETKQVFEKRFNRTWEQLRVVRDYEHQQSILRTAQVAYLGRVLARREVKGFMHEVKVEPVHSIKGTLPTAQQTLTDTLQTSCGPKGDGDATRAGVGEWVFVFGGLPKTDWRPNGYDSVLARDALTEDLLAALWKVGRSPDE